MTTEALSARHRAGYLEAQQATFGGLNPIFAKIFSFLSGGDQATESQPLFDLMGALRKFMQAPSALAVPAFKNQEHKAAFDEMCEAREDLVEKQFGLSRSIVAKNNVFSIRAFSKNAGLALVLSDENENSPKRLGVVEIPEKDLVTGKLDASLERGLKKLTKDLPDLQANVMEQFRNSSATSVDRKTAITRLQAATQSHDGLRDTLGFDKRLTTAVTDSWNEAWKASDSLKDSLGISGKIAADGKAYSITPFKNRDTGGFNFVLFNGDTQEINQVTVAPGASSETIRQAFKQLTEGHSTLQDKVLSRFDAATSSSQKVTVESGLSVEQLTPEIKQSAIKAAELGRAQLKEMLHAGPESKSPTPLAALRPQTQKSLG